MHIIQAIGIFQAVFMIGLLQSKKNKSLSDSILSWLFFLYALTIFLAWMEIYNRQNGYPYPFFIATAPPFILLHGPVLWFYIKSLTEQHFRFRPIYTLHFLPFAIFISAMAINLYSIAPEQRILADSTEAFKNQLFFPIFLAVIAVSTQAYNIWGLLLIRNHNRRIRNYFSQLDQIDLHWLRLLLVGSIVVHAFNSLLYIFDYLFGLMPYGLMQGIAFTFAAVLILFLGFFGHRQGNIFTEARIRFDLRKAAGTISKADAQPQSEDERFAQRLLQHMQNTRPHTNPNLTLAKLSHELSVSPEYLSAILNRQLKTTFFDFVNQYRVDCFKQLCLMPENQKLTLMAIAYDCGFNAKATFNRVFKNNTGETPSAWLKANLGK